MKRLISCVTSDYINMNPTLLKQSILASEGRVILAETVVTATPLLEGVTNAEVMTAFGADLLLLNEYDVFERKIEGLEGVKYPIKETKKMTGRPLGINLEPVETEGEFLEKLITLSKGRIATKETFIEAEKQEIDFICLTGNPATGVTNQSIKNSIGEAKQYFSGLIFAGKMHGAGIKEKLLDETLIVSFIEEGSDGIIIPAVGTVPGITEIAAEQIIKKVKEMGALTISAIGTSQESSDPETIRQIALSNKKVGCDIHHIGDGGYGRLPDPENILTLGITIKGKRHTYFKMSQSLLR